MEATTLPFFTFSTVPLTKTAFTILSTRISVLTVVSQKSSRWSEGGDKFNDKVIESVNAK
jgi:hypothetical protein